MQFKMSLLLLGIDGNSQSGANDNLMRFYKRIEFIVDIDNGIGIGKFLSIPLSLILIKLITQNC